MYRPQLSNLQEWKKLDTWNGNPLVKVAFNQAMNVVIIRLRSDETNRS